MLDSTNTRSIENATAAGAIADLSPADKRALLARLLRQKASAAPSFEPLSDNQQGIWFLSQLAPASAIYNVSFAQRIRSTLDIPAFRRAFEALVQRHPSLRTTFALQAGQPVQQVHPHASVPFEEIDATAWAEEQVPARLVEATQPPFDLERGPVMRVSLFRRSEREQILLLVVHHIVVDFWSLAVMMSELGALYAADLSGRPAVLPPLSADYRDFVRWQAALLAGPAGERLWHYWQSQLAGPLPLLALPTDRPRPPIQRLRGAQHDFTLSTERTRRLRALAKAEGATLYMVLLAAFELLLFNHTGQDDLLVASPMAGRSRAEFEGVVGFFANPVVLRARNTGNPPFRAFLAEVRQTVLAALDHQDYPTLRLVQRLHPPRDLSRAPLCQTMFVLDKPHRLGDPAEPALVGDQIGLRMTLGGLEMESIPLERRAASLDLVLLIIETSGSLAASLRFDSDLFDPATIARMAGHFETLLEGVIADPGTPIGLLEWLSAAERRQLLQGFNHIGPEYATGRYFHQLFEDQVRRTPDALVLRFEDQRLSYAQLNARANQLAHHLQWLGVGPEVPVALALGPCPELLIGVLGILKAGGAWLPLDPTLPPARLALMLADAAPPLVLSAAPWRAALPDHPGMVLCLDADWDVLVGKREDDPENGIDAHSLAYIIYTSGSTGQPKGVMGEHGGLINYLSWVNRELVGGRALSLPVTTRLSFDMSLKQLLAPLLRGGTVWLLPEAVLAEPVALLAAVAGEPGLVLNGVPSWWRTLLEAIQSGQAPAPEHLVELWFGGEPLSPELVARTRARLPQVQIWNIYGPTEATANAAATRLAPGDPLTIGRPIANTQLYVLNPWRQLVAIGVTGELYIGGAGVTRGYLNQPALTAEAFVPDTFSAGPFSAVPDARLYRSGDLARYRADGTLELLGRADHQVKLRGFRLELGEIEAALGRHPALRDAVVVLQAGATGPRPTDRESEPRLIAYVVPTPEGMPSTSTLRQFLKQSLPEYMVPALFVALERLPQLANGKVDRHALPAPERTRPALAQALVAPRTPTEQQLAALWAQLLELERVGIDDNFFDLGGHSLLATQLLSRVRDTFQVEIPLRRLFEGPTVAALALSIDTARATGPALPAPPIVPGPRDHALPLSFAQQRLWFFEQLQPGLAAYHLPVALRLEGPLNRAALEQSLNEIVRRHEALRTSFDHSDGRPCQIIAPSLTLTLPLVDLQALPADQRAAEIRRRVTAETRRPFDLVHGPLVRGTLLRLGPEDHVGLLTLHHLVSDGWSSGILVRELTTLYAAFCTGAASPLPDLPLQYADYAQWQRQWLQGELLARQLAYWQTALTGAPAALALPTNHPRPAVPSFNGAHQSRTLPPALAQGLSALCHQEGVTRFMALLAVFQLLLSRYSGQDDLMVGTPVANRTRLETEDLIGLFVNTLVLRTDLSGDPPFRELLGRVREVCLGAYGHQDLPFDRLVEALRLERDASRHPLFQVMFVLHTAALQSIEQPGLKLSLVEGESEAAHFDLTLQIGDSADGLSATLVYNTDLFEADTISRLLGHFQTLLAGVIAAPDQRLSELPLLSAAEREQLLVTWNQSESGAEPLPACCVHQLFEAQAARTPDALALIGGTEPLSYRELNRRANQLAHHLRALGVGPEVLVGLCLERSPELIIGLLAILKAGGATLPLDPAYPAARLAFLLGDAGAPLLLTRAGLMAHLAHQQATVIDLATAWDAEAEHSGDNPAPWANPDHLAYIIHTSGSTGQPKGVMVTHRALAGHCHTIRQAYHLDARDVVLQMASPSFDVCLEEILPTLISGGRLVLMGPTVWSPAELLARMAEFNLSVLNLPTAYWHELARTWAGLPAPLSAHQGPHQPIGTDFELVACPHLSSPASGGGTPTAPALPYSPLPRLRGRVGVGALAAGTEPRLAAMPDQPPHPTRLMPRSHPRLVIVGGEAMTAEGLALWQQTPFHQARLLNAYGPTEATISATLFEAVSEAGTPATMTTPLVPIGRPLAHRRAYILDPQDQPVPIGVAGQLHLGGAGLARGYLNQPELTAEKFIPDPFSSEAGARLYRTGDQARYRADGTIEFLGRTDQQVKIRGFRIEPGEIEAVLGQHPLVKQALVLARPDTQGEPQLVAYVVADAAEEELRRFLAEQLPRFMVPARWLHLEALPLLANGKIDRGALPAPALPAPDAALSARAQERVAPRDQLEHQLVQLWQEVLAVEPIGIRDNFFALGGHSLLAVRLFALIEQRLGQKLPLTAVFQGATIEQLAEMIRQHQATPPAHPALVALQPEGAKPPLFLVHPAGGHVFPYLALVRQLGPDQPCYGLQALGVSDEHAPAQPIEAMAAGYLEAIRTVQPAGPYRLGGWSMGGVVAYEMAQQLHTEGQVVTLLALFDGRIPTDEAGFPEQEAEALALVERYFGVSFEPTDGLADLPQEEQLGWLLEQAQSAGLVPAELELSQALRLVELLKRDVAATRSYRLQPYPGALHFFKAEETLSGSAADQTMGWGEWAGGGVEVHRVPGNHATMMSPPQVASLAETLTACLAQTHAGSEP